MIFLLLNLIFIFAPIARGSVRIWAYGPIYILTLVTFILCIFNLCSKGEVRIRRTPLDIPILLFAFIAVISILNSRYIYGSIMEIIRLIILALIFYIVVNFIKEEQEIKRMLNIILMTGTAIALFGILQYIGVINKSWWDNGKFLSATYVNHNHFAGLTELIIPLSIGMILSEKDAGKRSLYVYSFLLLCAAFLCSMSRGGWFCLSLSMLFMLVVISRKGKTRFIIFMLILLSIIFGIFLFNVVDLDFLLERVRGYWELDVSGRIDMWKGAVNIIKNNWLLGAGPGSFIYNFPKYRPAGLSTFVNYAHNDYLQVASEMGIFALLIMIFIIGRTIKKGLRTHNIARSSFKKWLSLSLTTGILSLALHGFGDFNFYIPSNAILFTVFSGLIFNISSRKETEYPQLVLRFNPILYGFFKPLALIVMTVLVIFISTSLAAEIYSTMSDKAIIRNELEYAEDLALRAEKLCPFNYVYPYKVAGIYSKKSFNRSDKEWLDESGEKYKKAISLNSLHAWSWIGLAEVQYRVFRYSALDYNLLYSAETAYKKALEIDPLNSAYLNKFAGFLSNLGNIDLSAKMYKKGLYAMSGSISKKFIDSDYYELKADTAFSYQDVENALLFYKLAEQFKEGSERAKLGQIKCYIKMSMLKDAMRKYKKIGFSEKNKSILFASLGDYYLKKGYIDTAGRFAKKLLLINSKDPEGHHLKYKIEKQKNRQKPTLKEIKELLDFNEMPISLNFESNKLEMLLEVNRFLARNEDLDFSIILPEGIYELYINARSTEVVDFWPQLIMKFNDRVIMDRYVDADNRRHYRSVIIVNNPVNKVYIFYKDHRDSKDIEDKILYIDRIRLKALY